MSVKDLESLDCSAQPAINGSMGTVNGGTVDVREEGGVWREKMDGMGRRGEEEKIGWGGEGRVDVYEGGMGRGGLMYVKVEWGGEGRVMYVKVEWGWERRGKWEWDGEGRGEKDDESKKESEIMVV